MHITPNAAREMPAGFPSKVHPITGLPVYPLGVTKRGQLMWPVMGGSQPTGDDQHQPPAHTPVPGPPPGPSPQPNPHHQPGPGQPTPAMFPPATGQGLNDNGYPDHTPVQQMTAEQQAAYWRTYARRNESRIKEMGDYQDLKGKAEAYQKLLDETATEQQKAVTAAEARGRQSALAEAGGQMVEAYVRAAATGRMSDEQVSTLLQGLDRTRFVNPSSGQVDAQMISAYIGMLAPAPAPGMFAAPVYAPPVPGQIPGQIPGQNGGQSMPGHYPPGTTVNGLIGAQGTQLTYGQAQPQPGQQPQWSTYPPQLQQQLPQQQPGQQPDMGQGRQVPSYGQAQYPSAPASGLEAGKAVARARFNKPAQQQR
ncbi:MAG: hypothetical protein ABWY93_18810 [Mycobacterium sp.]